MSKGGRINVNSAVFWSGRWESNPRPKFGNGLAPPPPSETGNNNTLAVRCLARHQPQSNELDGKPLTSWYSAFVAVWRLPYAP